MVGTVPEWLSTDLSSPLVHVELGSSMGDSMVSFVMGTSDDNPPGVIGGMQAEGLSGVAGERELELVKISEEGGNTGGVSERGGGGVERVAVAGSSASPGICDRDLRSLSDTRRSRDVDGMRLSRLRVSGVSCLVSSSLGSVLLWRRFLLAFSRAFSSAF